MVGTIPRYSTKEAGKADRLESILYPSPLLSAKTLPIPENMENKKDPKLISYTKHYYIGTERIASVIGSKRGLGAYCFSDNPSVSLEAMEIKVDAAGTAVQEAFAHFEKTITLPQPFLFSSGRYNCSSVQVPEDYAVFWYHPDHLGSSSYITNLAGEITQHMEYLPFGETLVEEHLNSNNSPYKFNAKEYDAETGNYYYGARYYDPKWSIMLSVDQMYDKYPSFSPYAYTLQNPVKYVDPTGMTAESPDNDYGLDKKGNITLVKKTDDDFDRIVKTDSDGNAKIKGEGFLGFLVPKSERGKEKVAVDKISKGILKDGLNLKENNGSFDVNGEGQPTLKEFDTFISEFSDYIGKEIAGVRLGRDKNSNDVDRVLTYKYEKSTRTESQTPRSWFTRGELKSHFHTHPYNDHTPSERDKRAKGAYPSLPFFIIAGGNEEKY